MEHCSKQTIRFPSSDGKTQVAAYFFTPNTPPKAVLQITHGMTEHIGHYEYLIDRFCAEGYAVCGQDHLGHGDTSPDSYGFFAEKDGHTLVLKDMYTMNRLAREKYPNLPYILYGHSMGSFFARWFAEKHPESQDLFIISGTGGPGIQFKFGKMLSSLFCGLFGPRHVSPLLHSLSNGAYGKAFPESTAAWISRDPAVWEAYGKDPKCKFIFTVSGYRDMLTVYNHVNAGETFRRYRKDLPMLLVSGDEDPVGGYGKGVREVYRLLREAGVEDVTLRLYQGGRHEMHNDIVKEEVLTEMLAWCNQRIGG